MSQSSGIRILVSRTSKIFAAVFVFSLGVIMNAESVHAQMRLGTLVGQAESGPQGEPRFEITTKVKIPLDSFYIYPGISVIADALNRQPHALIEVWTQERENNLVRLTGTNAEILQTLSYRVLDGELDSLEVYADRFIFFKMQRPIKIHSFGNALRGASLLSAMGIASIVSKAATAKKAFNAVQWVGRGLRGAHAVSVAAASAPTPEKAAVPVWAIELGVVVVIQVASEVAINYIEYRMEKSQIQKSLLRDLKAYEENRKVQPSALTNAVEVQLRGSILQKFEELFFYMNKDSRSKYINHHSKVVSLAQKLKKRRESEKKIDEETFNYTLPYRTTQIIPGHLNTIHVPSTEERNRKRLDDFEIRVPTKRLRDFQNFRKTQFTNFSSYHSLSDEAMTLLFKGERFLRDAYYLYVHREKYDRIVADAGFDLMTSRSEKGWWGIGSLGVNDSLAENLKAEFDDSIHLRDFNGDANAIYQDALENDSLALNVFDLMIVELGFLQSINSSDELSYLEHLMRDRITLAQERDFHSIAADLLSNMKTAWDQIYLDAVGIDEARWLDLRNLMPPEARSDQDELWMESDFAVLLR